MDLNLFYCCRQVFVQLSCPLDLIIGNCNKDVVIIIINFTFVVNCYILYRLDDFFKPRKRIGGFHVKLMTQCVI